MPPRQLTHGWFKRLNRTLLGGCILLIGLASALANWDFGVILQNAESRYGNLGAAKQRIQAWEAQIKASANSSERDKLTEVNRFFNRQIRFVDDIQLWKQNDYWATPIEMLIKGAGDCEDYSIAKYFTLRRLGIPSDKLRITYVKALNYNQAHMVLTYYASPGAEPLVLDNLINEIKPASQRKDLLPVYAFNAEGLYLAGSNSKKSDTKKLSRWQDILKKMRTEGFAIGEG
ncbi:MAG: transglutaminase-like cysteine peptidase [Pseudomonas sp.]|uniref:cysteine protease LapG n=1 Tax=Pseudomonas sp. TaxID=306 RepID=UPI00271C74EC|nr:transglutaminase-like cysteine peptidase [Pseudomonas sp.]MDO9619538.1 transglutaminase-like cysteine peptidase [Pseudomonas sp.]MDP2446171.1 transglutaminase-like cysteine peptidase [Pseudomonas sp.]MDZ4333112.1 transglutaminase-like cysteine peptidase [Pseudomonas sp.]